MKSLELQTVQLLEAINGFMKAESPLHPGALITDSDDEPAAATVARVLGLWKRRVVAAYECPVCGKNSDKVAPDGEIWNCSAGHLRKTEELEGNMPWRDLAGTWHDLELRSRHA